MLRFIVKRIAQSVIVLFFVVLFAFIVVRLAPADPARMLAGENASEETVAAIRAEFGLDRSYPEQFFIYIANIFKGDLGTSLQYRLPCTQVIFPRVLVSARLALSTILVVILISIPLGVIAGSKRGSFTEFFAMGVAMIGQSLAPVWLCVFMIYIFSVKLGWLPSMGNDAGIKFVILPVISLGMQHIASSTRMCRSEMIDVLGQDYITATRARGISRREVRWKYALKNTMAPVVTLLGMKLGGMLAGTVIVETIFVWPGVGQMLSQAVAVRDYPLVQSGLLVSATLVATINLLVDIINAWVDPRITLN